MFFFKKLIINFLTKRNLTRGGNSYVDHQYVSYDSIVQKSTLHREVRIGTGASVKHSSVGELSSIGRNTKITHSKIGKYCAISWDSTINAISHPITKLSVSAFPYVPHVGGFVSKRIQEHQEVVIGNDVWVGAHVVVMPGVTVGNGAILAAGAIVNKDVPPYAIVAGVPAKIIKYRFTPDIIDQLESIRWWDMDRASIKENIEVFQKDVDQSIIDRLKSLSTN